MTLPLTLAPGLPVVGTLSYGGVPFEELLKSKVTGRPEWDRARRVVKYVKYTIEVDGYVISKDSAPNDPTWADLRFTLQRPGLTLTYTDRGFSNLTVNKVNAGPNDLVDVCDGPKPEILEFTPLGARLAAHIVWKCEVCLPEIANRGGGKQLPFPRGILSFNWTTDLSFGDDGYANYTVEGELEIARVFGQNGENYNLENYRAYTEPQLPVGFKPTQRVFKTDDAKRQIKFAYSFQELPPMGIPIRCTKAGGSYQVVNKGNVVASTVNWTATLQANYKTVPTGPRREAYMRFLGLLRDRLRFVREATTPVVALGGAAANPSAIAESGGAGYGVTTVSPDSVSNTAVRAGSNFTIAGVSNVIIRKFAINEGLYEDSKSSSFECSWTFVTTFRNLFIACGAWRKMDDCAGQVGPDGKDVWVTDMARIVGYTSWYRYGFRPESEVIIQPNESALLPMAQGDKLATTGPTYPNDGNRKCSAGAGLVRDGVDPDTGRSPDVDVRIPGLLSPEASWLNYQIEFVTDLDPGMALHKPLPQRDDEVDTLGSADLFGYNPEFDKNNGLNTVSRSTGQDILQRMATSTYRVCLRGFGVRAGYHVPVPDLKVFGGVEVSPSKQRVVGPRVMANYSGIPVYMTAWVLWYDVPSPPRARQDAPPNLAQHIGDVKNPPKEIQVPVSVPEPPIVSTRTDIFRPLLPRQ